MKNKIKHSIVIFTFLCITYLIFTFINWDFLFYKSMNNRIGFVMVFGMATMIYLLERYIEGKL